MHTLAEGKKDRRQNCSSRFDPSELVRKVTQKGKAERAVFRPHGSGGAGRGWREYIEDGETQHR